MDFGERMMLARKEKSLSRDQLGKLIDTSSQIIGRYERNDMKPSIDIAKKIAQALDISLDYLVGNASIVVKDKKAMERLERIIQMPKDKREELFNVVDAYLRDFSTQKAYS